MSNYLFISALNLILINKNKNYFLSANIIKKFNNFDVIIDG